MDDSPARYVFKPARTSTVMEAALSRLHVSALSLVGMLMETSVSAAWVVEVAGAFCPGVPVVICVALGELLHLLRPPLPHL